MNNLYKAITRLEELEPKERQEVVEDLTRCLLLFLKKADVREVAHLERAMFRWLTDQGVWPSESTCPSCGEEALAYTNGCYICYACGFSKCE